MIDITVLDSFQVTTCISFPYLCLRHHSNHAVDLPAIDCWRDTAILYMYKCTYGCKVVDLSEALIIVFAEKLLKTRDSITLMCIS